MKRICRYLPALSLLMLCAPFAHAQSSVDFMAGFGTAHDSANSNGLDNSALSSCSPIGSTSITTGGTCVSTPSLGGFFLGFGGDVILWKNLGFGAEVSFQPAHSQFINIPDYGPLNYRQTFYDFNAVYEPVHTKRVSLQIEGGPGGAKTGFSIASSTCVGSACVSQTEPVVNSNHFQVHAGVGVSIFVTEHIFIRPQFDIHYVPNLTDQPGFGSNLVTAGTVWVGYNFGSR
ncbi:MAG TPA: outer membrane beta-barrel protein [Bryobacteraceae bacterium]|nr:outer membrane beta-barrel protein [Bryobacteraceae bacterium]